MNHLQPSALQDGEQVTFKLHLNCQAKKSSEVKLLRLPSFPTSVGEIKKAIQAEFSIPACVQTLSYHSIPLTGNGSLLDTCRHIRSHDTLTVNYSCEADVKKIDEVVGWVREVAQCLRREEAEPNAVKTSYTLIHRGVRNKYDLVLALEIFDWMDAKAYVNKLYFMDGGGLEAVLVLYEFVLEKEWTKMSESCQFLEAFCSHAIANFGETLYLRRVLVERDGLDMTTRSLKRVRMRIEGDLVSEGLVSPTAGGSEYSRYALKRTLENALHTICNLSELPECQVAIASDPFLPYQALCVSLSNSFHSSVSVLVSELFLCLAHNPATHQYLAKPNIILTLGKVCLKFEVIGPSRQEYLLCTALRCFTYMVFAQIAMVSSHLLPLSTVRSMTICMSSFLSAANTSDIIEYEENQGCVWATLLPYLKLFYLPAKAGNISQHSDHYHPPTPTTSGSFGDPQSESTTPSPSSGERHALCADDEDAHSQNKTFSSEYAQLPPNIPESEEGGLTYRPDSEEASRWQEVKLLKRVSLSMVLFFLHTKMSRECHCKVLLEEDLVDFVTCLPWHVAAASKERAEQVVWELNSHIKLQPPRLFNLSRAVLARVHFGLDTVVRVNSPMELARKILDPA